MFKLNYNKINGSLVEHSIPKRDLAKHLGLSETQTYKKLNGKVDLKVTELLAIADLLQKDPSIFFTQQVDKISTINTHRA